MNDPFFTYIATNKIPCVFVSPHFDDAVLSCGSALSYLSGKTDILVINVFTNAHSGPYTLSANKFVSLSGEHDAKTLYEKRRLEDERALKKLKVDFVNFGFEDAIFRMKTNKSILGNFISEYNHMYPTYRWHIIKNVSSGDPAVLQLKKKMNPYIGSKTLLFAPFAVGNHVDHQIVRKVSERLCSSRTVLYSDFPYNVSEGNYGSPAKDRKLVTITPSKGKEKLIKMYSTQFKGLFPDGAIPVHKEVYFVPNNLWYTIK